jgi:hypothetical protein
MEARLMARLDAFQEAIMERVGVLDASISALTEIERSTNTTMSRTVRLLTIDGPNR